MAPNIILLSGGPGLFQRGDVEHDLSWANYVTPPLLLTQTDDLNKKFMGENEVWWLVYRPAYEARWTDDLVRNKSETDRVKAMGFADYVDLLRSRATSRGWNLRFLHDAAYLWRLLATFQEPIRRFIYWGHARDDLWLTLGHVSTTPTRPDEDAVVKVSDIATAVAADSGLPWRFRFADAGNKHQFIGCNTTAFAREWSSTMGVWAQGVTGKVDFSAIHGSGGVPSLVDKATITSFEKGTEKSSGSTWGGRGAPAAARRRIFIDAGHGGHAEAGRSTAFGARGAMGTLEKDITLDIARRVVARLGGDAHLVRDSDVNIPLGARAEHAARNDADVFVSIHANSGDPARSGPETFVHPQAGPGSRRLAAGIHAALERLAPRLGGGRGSREERMAVLDPRLLGSSASACLIEVDYLSNPLSEQRLRDVVHRDAMSQAIAGAIAEHLEGGARLGDRGRAPARHLARRVGGGGAKRALVVGINDYSLAGWNSLRNCVNDANAMETLLGGLGFQVVKLTDRDAARARILRELRAQLDASRAGDVLCFYYSGHGSTEPDPQPGVPNHWAQSLAVADGGKILDRDLADLIGTAADGLNLTIILDSCHSGGMGESVGVPETIRGLPLPAELTALEGQSLSITPIGVVDPQFSQAASVHNARLMCEARPNTTTVPHAKATLFTAVDYNELASDGPGLANGLYTAALRKVLERGFSGMSNEVVQRSVVEEVEAIKSASGLGADWQNAMLRAQGSRMDDAFLEGYTQSEYGLALGGREASAARARVLDAGYSRGLGSEVDGACDACGAALAGSGFPEAQQARLRAMMSKVRDAGVDDRYVNGFDSLLRTLGPRLTDDQLAALLDQNHVRADLVKAAADAGNVVTHLDLLDQRMLKGIAWLNEKMHTQGATLAQALLQIKDWVADRQRDQNSVYWCYGEGQG